MSISSSEQTTVTCPTCQQPVTAEVWSIVDAGERPDLADQLLDGTLNVATCPRDGTLIAVNAPVLFHDQARRRLAFAGTPEMEEHAVRDAAQALLERLLAQLPADSHMAYLGDVQVEGDLAGLRRSVARTRRRAATPAAPAATQSAPAVPGLPVIPGLVRGSAIPSALPRASAPAPAAPSTPRRPAPATQPEDDTPAAALATPTAQPLDDTQAAAPAAPTSANPKAPSMSATAADPNAAAAPRQPRVATPAPSTGAPASADPSAAAPPHVVAPDPAAHRTAPAASTVTSEAEDILELIQNLLTCDTLEEFRAYAAANPLLLTDDADTSLQELIGLASAQKDREIAEALRHARAGLAEVRGRVIAPVVGPPAPPADAPLATKLSAGAQQALLLAENAVALLDVCRDYPALLEPWADAEIAAQVDAAYEAGAERLALTIEERRAALAEVRAEQMSTASIATAVNALLAARDDDTRAETIGAYPALLTDAGREALLAAPAPAGGAPQLHQRNVQSLATTLRQVRAEIEA